MLHKVLSKITNLVKLGFISTSVDDSGSRQILNVSYFGKQIKALNIQPYGHYSNPPDIDSLVVLLGVAGTDSNPVGFVTNPSTRFKNLEKGEVKNGNVLTGSFIFFDKDGNVTVESKGEKIILKVGSATLTLTETSLVSSVPFSAPDYTNESGGNATFSSGIDMSGQDVVNVGSSNISTATHKHGGVQTGAGETGIPIN